MSGGVRTLLRGGGMSTAGRVAVLVLAAAVTLGGCRDAAAPTAGSPAGTSDPLGSVETRVDQIEKQLDHDGTR